MYKRQSNAGAQNIVAPKRLGFLSTEDERKDYEYMKGQVMEEVKRMFKPEFLNRIDEIIVFHQLTKADMKKILQILLKDLERRCKEQMDIELKVRDTVKEYLVENSFDSKYGARPLKRAIQSLSLIHIYALLTRPPLSQLRINPKKST